MKRLFHNHRVLPTGRQAFTLVELLVVIAIIGMLSTIAVVALGQARLKGYDTKRTADVKQIMTALQLYYENNGAYPNTSALGCVGTSFCLGHGNAGTCWAGSINGCTALDNALAPYIAKIPDDPENDTRYYGDAYTYSNNFGCCGLAGSTAMIWGHDEPTNSNTCLGGVYGPYTTEHPNHYWCGVALPK